MKYKHETDMKNTVSRKITSANAKKIISFRQWYLSDYHVRF